MTQQTAVFLIGILVACYIALRVILLFSGRGKRKKDPCFGCQGCTLREELNKKKKDCPDRVEK